MEVVIIAVCSGLVALILFCICACYFLYERASKLRRVHPRVVDIKKKPTAAEELALAPHVHLRPHLTPQRTVTTAEGKHGEVMGWGRTAFGPGGLCIYNMASRRARHEYLL